MGSVIPLVPPDTVRPKRRLVSPSPTRAPHPVSPRAFGPAGLLAVGLATTGIAFSALAAGFFIYQTNGERFWPIGREIVPFDAWLPGDQGFFWRLLIIVAICAGLLALTWTGMLVAFLNRSVRKRFALWRAESRAARRDRHFRQTVERLKRLA